LVRRFTVNKANWEKFMAKLAGMILVGVAQERSTRNATGLIDLSVDDREFIAYR
jgi:hypothetical protein